MPLLFWLFISCIVIFPDIFWAAGHNSEFVIDGWTCVTSDSCCSLWTACTLLMSVLCCSPFDETWESTRPRLLGFIRRQEGGWRDVLPRGDADGLADLCCCPWHGLICRSKKLNSLTLRFIKEASHFLLPSSMCCPLILPSVLDLCTVISVKLDLLY